MERERDSIYLPLLYGGRGAHYKMIKNSRVGRGVTERSASEVSVLTQIHKMPKEVLKYSFLHVSLLKNDSCQLVKFSLLMENRMSKYSEWYTDGTHTHLTHKQVSPRQ